MDWLGLASVSLGGLALGLTFRWRHSVQRAHRRALEAFDDADRLLDETLTLGELVHRMTIGPGPHVLPCPVCDQLATARGLAVEARERVLGERPPRGP